jgi:type I restriction enzyme M protein
MPAKGGKDPIEALHAAEQEQATVLEVVRSLLGTAVNSRQEFDGLLTKAFVSVGVMRDLKVNKAIWDAVSVADSDGELQTDRKGQPLPDPDLRDNENVPLGEDIDDYMKREVLPHVPDAWLDESKTKIGYEVPFTRHFYVYTPPRPLAEIDAEIKRLEGEIQQLLKEVTP